MFWGGDDSIVLAPRPIHPVFVQYIQERLGLRRLVVRSPRLDSGRLCADALTDSALLHEVVTTLQRGDTATLLAYGATATVYQLIDALAAHGATIATPDLPARASYWTSLYYDSKAGCRHLCAELAGTAPHLRMPEGFICHSLDQAIEYIRYFHGRHTGCVVKANLGVGGIATIVLGPGWARRSLRTLRRHLHQWGAAVPYFFAMGPIIVEQHVTAQRGCGAAGPAAGAISMHAIVAGDRQTQVLGSTCELRDTENAYVGAQMGKGAVCTDVMAQIEPLMQTLSTAMGSRGYRGHVGIDLLLDAAGTPWLLEVNPRRCSPAHVYDIGTRLFGPNWAITRYALSRLPLDITVERPLAIEQVLDAIDTANRHVQELGVLIMPTCLSGLAAPDPLIGYVIFGPDRQTVLAGEPVLLVALRRAGIHARRSHVTVW